MAVDINKLFLHINRVRLKDSPDTHFNYVAYLVSKRQGEHYIHSEQPSYTNNCVVVNVVPFLGLHNKSAVPLRL